MSSAKNATGQATHARLQANASGAAFWRRGPAANTSVDALLQLSEEVLDQTAQLLPLGLSNATSPAPARQREEQTLQALADHSGQLERLFHQLQSEMETQDGKTVLPGEDEEQLEAKAMDRKAAARDRKAQADGLALATAAGEAVAAEEAHEDAQADRASDLRLFSDAPAAHRLAAAAGIEANLLDAGPTTRTYGEPTMTEAYGDGRAPRVVRHERRGFSGARLGVGVLIACLLLVGTVALWLHQRLQEEEQKPAAAADAAESPRTCAPRVEPREGKTSYVVRVVRVRVEGLTAQALAWQLQVGEQQPRPSRFATNWVWDAPVDRLDVDVDSPTEKLSIALLEQPTSLLDPPTVIANVELAAGVLLAEARKNVEKVKSSRQADQYVHEKRFALPRGGSLVLEYSLIAFFHWYVGGEHAARA